jgi:hypothetical protein
MTFNFIYKQMPGDHNEYETKRRLMFKKHSAENEKNLGLGKDMAMGYRGGTHRLSWYANKVN